MRGVKMFDFVQNVFVVVKFQKPKKIILPEKFQTKLSPNTLEEKINELTGNYIEPD